MCKKIKTRWNYIFFISHINIIVLGDTDRVILINNNNGSNYINAVYVNGYKNKNAFVTTQVPLEHTLAEYWLMVFECNIQTIVWIHGINESEELPEFPPSLSSLVRESKMEVELLSDVENGGINEKKILLSQGEVRCLKCYLSLEDLRQILCGFFYLKNKKTNRLLHCSYLMQSFTLFYFSVKP